MVKKSIMFSVRNGKNKNDTEEKKPLLSAKDENLIEDYSDHKPLTAFSILLSIANSKEVLILLPIICKTLLHQSNYYKSRSEEYHFKIQQLSARDYVNNSMRLNRGKLEKLEWFLALLPLGYAGIPNELSKLAKKGHSESRQTIHSFLSLWEEKPSSLSKEKIQKFKNTYRKFLTDLPIKLNSYKTADKNDLEEIACIFLFKPCLGLLFLSPVYFKYLVVSSVIFGGTACCVAENLAEELVNNINDRVTQIGKLSGFDFLEKFTFEKLRRESKLQIKEDLAQLENLQVVSNLNSNMICKNTSSY